MLDRTYQRLCQKAKFTISKIVIVSFWDHGCKPGSELRSFTLPYDKEDQAYDFRDMAESDSRIEWVRIQIIDINRN